MSGLPRSEAPQVGDNDVPLGFALADFLLYNFRAMELLSWPQVGSESHSAIGELSHEHHHDSNNCRSRSSAWRRRFLWPRPLVLSRCRLGLIEVPYLT